MRKLVAAFTVLWCLAPGHVYSQTTVYYQPTPYPAKIKNGIHLLDGWLPSVYYGQTFQGSDGRLLVGGWGDTYLTYIQFDLTGLPPAVTSAALSLYSDSCAGCAGPTYFYAQYPNSPWATESPPLQNGVVLGNLSTTLTWSTQPSSFSNIGTESYQSIDQFWNIDITSLYNNWQRATMPTPNYGLTLTPLTTDNTFDYWRSSRIKNDAQRPLLKLTFTPPIPIPAFKMPLPRNVSWLVSTEVGGWDCNGGINGANSNTPDPAHAGKRYFSIDFPWGNKDQNGNINYAYGDPDQGAMIPITPAADGVVMNIGQNDSILPPNGPDGYYVVIAHKPTLFETYYVHLKWAPLVAVGTHVVQGQTILGYMGCTGKYANGEPSCMGAHLHFGMKYNGDGSSNTYIRYATMSGWLLKSFQSECADGKYGRYYLSN